MLGITLLQESKTFSEHLARVLIPPGRHEVLDKLVLVLPQNHIACWHPNHPDWHHMPIGHKSWWHSFPNNGLTLSQRQG